MRARSAKECEALALGHSRTSRAKLLQPNALEPAGWVRRWQRRRRRVGCRRSRPGGCHVGGLLFRRRRGAARGHPQRHLAAARCQTTRCSNSGAPTGRQTERPPANHLSEPPGPAAAAQGSIKEAGTPPPRRSVGEWLGEIWYEMPPRHTYLVAGREIKACNAGLEVLARVRNVPESRPLRGRLPPLRRRSHRRPAI